MFYAFDLLHLDGKDLTGEPLLQRRARLAQVLEGSGLLPSEALPGTAAAIVEAVRTLVAILTRFPPRPTESSICSRFRRPIAPA